MKTAPRTTSTSSLKTPTPWLIAGVIWITLQVVLQQRGFLSHDTRFDVLFDPRDFLARTWHLWDGRADMGRIQNQTVGYLFPLGPFYWLGDLLAVPAWISERLWMALLLGLAFWGSARLADELSIGTPPTRLLAAASYALSPFFIARVGNTSFFVQGAAMLPWVLLPLVRGSTFGSPRRAAFRSGLAILAIGGINALGTAAVLVVPAAWIISRERGPRRRSLAGWWIAAVACATSWWGIALLFQGRYGMNFLPLTERAKLTTSPTAPFEVVRGAADWLSHLALDVPQLPSGEVLVSSRPVIAATGLVAALGVFGLCRRDIPQRRFFATTLLVGVALVGAGYGGAFGNPFNSAVVSFLDGPGAAFRNVYKFQPIVMLPLAMGVAHGAAVATAAAERLHQSRRDVLGGIALLALGALVLLSAQPLFDNRLLNAKPFSRVPDWWTESADYLQNVPGRTLVVPGLPHADSWWGYTAEEPLFWLTNQPWASRTLIPLGSYGGIRYLDAVEGALARGGDPSLVSFLQRGGFSTVLVRNDGNWRTYSAPPPRTVNTALTGSGLVRVASFGPPYDDPEQSGGSDLHQIDVYAVPAGATPDTRVTTYAAADTAVVSGDPASSLTLERWGLANRGLILAGDVSSSETIPSEWIVTDANRRRAINFGTTRDNQSYVLAANQKLVAGAEMYPGDQVRDQTVAGFDSIKRIIASSYGSLYRAEPEWAPVRAIDGDATTAWAPAIEVPLQDQWLQVDLTQPTQLSTVEVQLLRPTDQPTAVQVLRVTTEGGTIHTKVDTNNATQHLKVPPGATSWIQVAFDFVEGEPRRAGISELTIAGIDVARHLEPPNQYASQFSDPSHATPTYVFDRLLADPENGAEADPESSLRRRFSLPHDGRVQVDAKVAAAPGPAVLDLLDSTPSFTVTATSTFRSLPRFAPRNLVDGNSDTAWVSGLLDDRFTPEADPLVTMRWREPRRLDSIVVRAAPGYDQPRSARIQAGDEVRLVALSTEGEGSFPALTTDHVSVQLTLPPSPIHRLETPDVETMRLGLSTLEFPALRDLQPGPVDSSAPVTIDCAQGPAVDLAGTRRAFSVKATLDDVIHLRAIDAVPCDGTPINLASGQHDLSSDSSNGPFVIQGVRLMDPTLESSPQTTARAAEVIAWNDEHREVRVAAGEASYLAINENANDGWRATLNGRALESVVFDGWRQGYLVPAGEGGVVEVQFTPNTLYRAGLILGLLLVLLLIAGSLLPGRRSDPDPVGEAHWPRALAIGVPLVLAFIIGGPVALIAVGVLAVRRLPAEAASVMVALLLVAATIGAALPLPFDRTDLWKTFGSAVSALVVLALAALAATTLPSAAERRL